jgi:O-antigen/teichoic acid export membrane protein
MAAAAALNVALNAVAVPRLSILGAALATLAAYLFAMLATGVLARGEPRLELDVVAVGKSAVGTLAMVAVVVAMGRWWEAPVPVWTVGAALAGAGVFAAATLLLRTFSEEERELLLALLGRGRS